MRQTGYLAAAGLYALKNNIERLEEDHKHAKRIAKALTNSAFVKHVEPVETNIILFDLNDEIDMDVYLKTWKEKGVLALSTSKKRIRLVTHLDVSKEMVERVCDSV